MICSSIKSRIVLFFWRITYDPCVEKLDHSRFKKPSNFFTLVGFTALQSVNTNFRCSEAFETLCAKSKAWLGGRMLKIQSKAPHSSICSARFGALGLAIQVYQHGASWLDRVNRFAIAAPWCQLSVLRLASLNKNVSVNIRTSISNLCLAHLVTAKLRVAEPTKPFTKSPGT